MTGFFSRMLERARTPAAQVEPIVAPLFAPLAAEAAVPSRTAPLAPREGHATTEEASVPQSPMPRPALANAMTATQTTRTAADAPIPLGREAAARDRDPLDSALSARIDSLLALAGRIRQPLLADPGAGETHTVTLREVVHRTERITALEPVAPSLSPRQADVVPVRPPTASIGARPTTAVLRRADIAPVVRAATAAPRDRVPDLPPVVRINIGRIEVRAIASAPPPAAPRPLAPKTMGLDEYLASRDGRRER